MQSSYGADHDLFCQSYLKTRPAVGNEYDEAMSSGGASAGRTLSDATTNRQRSADTVASGGGTENGYPSAGAESVKVVYESTASSLILSSPR